MHETMHHGFLASTRPGGVLTFRRHLISGPTTRDVARFEVSNAGQSPEISGAMLVGRKGRDPVIRPVESMIESLQRMTADRSLYYLLPARHVGVYPPPDDVDQAHAAAAIVMALTDKVEGVCLLPIAIRAYDFFPDLIRNAAKVATFDFKLSGCNYEVSQKPVRGARTVSPLRIAKAISSFTGPLEALEHITRWPRDPVFTMVRLLFPDSVPKLPSSWRNAANIWTKPGGVKVKQSETRTFIADGEMFGVVSFVSKAGDYGRPMWVVL